MIHQFLNFLDNPDEKTFSDIAFKVVQKLWILFDDLLGGIDQDKQPVGKLLTSEDLLYERSFKSFEGVNLLNSASNDLLHATAGQKVHTRREDRVVLLGGSGIAINMYQYTSYDQNDADAGV
jgi:hypothetical protein